MTLRAWIITMRGRVREALVPELQVLRDQNRSLRADYQQIVAQRNFCMARVEKAEAERDEARVEVERLRGALSFILAFYEPGQTYLDTNAWKQAEASARAALKETK